MKKPIYMRYDYKKGWNRRNNIFGFIGGFFWLLIIICIINIFHGEWEYILGLVVIKYITNWIYNYAKRLEDKYNIWGLQKHYLKWNTIKAINNMKDENLYEIGWNLK